MGQIISRVDFERLIKSQMERFNLSEEETRTLVKKFLESEGVAIQEPPKVNLLEQVRRAQVLAGEQVVVDNLRQLEAGLKYKDVPLVEQVRHAQVNIAEQMCCDFVNAQHK